MICKFVDCMCRMFCVYMFKNVALLALCSGNSRLHTKSTTASSFSSSNSIKTAFRVCFAFAITGLYFGGLERDSLSSVGIPPQASAIQFYVASSSVICLAIMSSAFSMRFRVSSSSKSSYVFPGTLAVSRYSASRSYSRYYSVN